MDFKIKGKVKLVENDTALLKKLLEYIDFSAGYRSGKLLVDMSKKLTDEQYHELCHQAYLYQLKDEDNDDDLFCKDDGKLHDSFLEKWENTYKRVYKNRMNELADPEYRRLYPETNVDYERRKAKMEYEQDMYKSMKDYKFGLMEVIFKSALGWNVFCSTLNALKKNDNETDEDGIRYRVDP